MTGSWCAWLRGRCVVAGVVAATCVALAVSPSTARNDGGSERNEQRDGQSRNERPQLDRIPVIAGDDRLVVTRIVLIQTRLVQVSDPSLGVDFDSLDRVDVSRIPLLGQLFDRPLNAADFTDETRVGAVYGAGDGTLAAVVGDDVDVAASKVSVVNGKGRFEIRAGPRRVEIVPESLGEFGTLPSVQTMMAGTATRDTGILLGGLTRTSVPEGQDKVPVLGDIPVLQGLFRGTVHRGRNDRLLIFIRPSIVVGDAES